MHTFRRVDVLGCPFDAVSFDETLRAIREAVTLGRRLQVVPGNIDFVMKARGDPVFARELARADLVVADGVPLVWAASLLGEPLRGRVSGTDIVWNCAAIAAELGRGVALVGGRFELACRAAARMIERFPRARVAPVRTPFPLTGEASERLARAIRDQEAAIVLVALGAPRQERWVQRYLDACGANVGIGVGSAFDIISGDKPRAPRWMRDHGLEWLVRMLQEPGRLGRRYLLENSPFVFILARHLVKRKFASRGGTYG